MGASQVARIVLCGFLVGVLWFLLAGVALAWVGADLLASLHADAHHPRMGGSVFFGIDLLMGIWAMWLYSALEPSYGPGVRTGLVVGIAWWLLKSLQSAKWVGLGFVPAGLTVSLLLATLLATVVAAVFGSWIYGKVSVSRPRHVESPE
jgi:hypothetical protein